MLKNKNIFSGQPGIPSLSTMWAYLQFMQHCAERKLDYFIAAPDIGWIYVPLSLLRFQNENGGFNFVKASEYLVYMRGLQKTNKTAFYQQIQDTLKNYTDYTLLDHSK